MKIVKILCIWTLLCPLVCFAQKKDYLYYVREHNDNLIRHGKDTYGARSTRMLASIIDTRDMSVPKGNVPPTEESGVLTVLWEEAISTTMQK